jgi:ribA/ribD-fused uncharacterized protein
MKSSHPIQFTFFWFGPLSNWHRSPFLAELWDGIPRRFCTAEQWMMAAKALLFLDQSSLRAIMAATDPKAQKALGRKVSGYDNATWNAHARNLVYAGCSHKFEQNPQLGESLLATKGTLAEASPYDTIWGIGLAESDPRSRDPAQWRGTNWLGQALMMVRKDLRNPEHMAAKRKLILHAAQHNLPKEELFLQSSS